MPAAVTAYQRAKLSIQCRNDDTGQLIALVHDCGITADRDPKATCRDCPFRTDRVELPDFGHSFGFEAKVMPWVLLRYVVGHWLSAPEKGMPRNASHHGRSASREAIRRYSFRCESVW